MPLIYALRERGRPKTHLDHCTAPCLRFSSSSSSLFCSAHILLICMTRCKEKKIIQQ